MFGEDHDQFWRTGTGRTSVRSRAFRPRHSRARPSLIHAARGRRSHDRRSRRPEPLSGRTQSVTRRSRASDGHRPPKSCKRRMLSADDQSVDCCLPVLGGDARRPPPAVGAPARRSPQRVDLQRSPHREPSTTPNQSGSPSRQSRPPPSARAATTTRRPMSATSNCCGRNWMTR